MHLNIVQTAHNKKYWDQQKMGISPLLDVLIKILIALTMKTFNPKDDIYHIIMICVPKNNHDRHETLIVIHAIS